MLNIEATDILTRIISKKGMIGHAAKLCVNDKENAHQFIMDCSEHCHHKQTIAHFGEELVRDIQKYKSNFEFKLDR